MPVTQVLGGAAATSTTRRVAGMSTGDSAPLVTGVDFVSIPTRDLERAVAFYGDMLGMRRTVHVPERSFAEFENGTVTFNLHDPERMGIGSFQPNANHLALHVEDVAAARAELEGRGVEFFGDIVDSGVCHMAYFKDVDGNALMLHHRYAPPEARPTAA
jgi:catechol 2,3-dioxygenase-like lactoylglutathione lyase family enzyme